MIPNEYFEQFTTPKYRARNPLQRLLIRRFVERLHALFVDANPARTILEVGVGQGFLTGYLSERFPEKRFVGVDLSADDLAELNRLFPRVETHCRSIYDISSLGERFDVLICAEVLEHLEDPGRALEQIAAVASHRAIFTVPHEPWFMLSNLLRGKNISRLGNDVDHVGHYSARAFRRLLEAQFTVEQLVASFPWLLAVTRPL